MSKQKIKIWWQSIDKWILSSTLLLLLLGTFLIMSSSLIHAEKNSLEEQLLIKKHLFFLLLTLTIILSTTIFKREKIVLICGILCLIFLFLSIFPSFFFNEIKGANRWINIFGYSLQPSEFLKPTFVIISATLLSRFQKKKDFSLSVNFVLLLFIILVLFLQPDFGMSFLIFVTWSVQVFMYGLSLKLILIIFIFGTFMFTFAYNYFPHVKFRIDSFLNVDVGDKYQVNKSLEAFSSGGLTGNGIGTAKISNSLPDVQSDFILALAAEEMGFITVLIIIMLFSLIFLRSLTYSFNSSNMFDFLSLSGLAIVFFLQFLINLLSTLSLIPTKGMTLPFISYGGSSMLSCGLLIGLILSLSRKRYEG
tara:strand:- start:5144 stop:6235 length:1092 start_codon:yes stop_codon:yes gene_type:complete